MMPLTDPAYDKAVASSDSEPPITGRHAQGADRCMSPWFPDQPGLSRVWVAS